MIPELPQHDPTQCASKGPLALERAHGFTPNRSIITHAQNHVGRRWVLTLDLSDFFPSTHRGLIRQHLEPLIEFCCRKPRAAAVLSRELAQAGDNLVALCLVVRRAALQET